MGERKRSGNERAFTLIELLVVVSIIAMLMALLFPVLHRARNQAKATLCQARMHQWSLVFKMYTDDNNGRWFKRLMFNPRAQETNLRSWRCATVRLWAEPGMALCPMATTHRWPPDKYSAFGDFLGFALDAKGSVVQTHFSYGFNESAGWSEEHESYWALTPLDYFWRTPDVRGAARVPLLYDSVADMPFLSGTWPPPAMDTWEGYLQSGYFMVMERHEGGNNMLFMDWSVRKVSLKELWTFKWYPAYDTAGPWTKAGGVQSEDWPAWMRGFKDY